LAPGEALCIPRGTVHHFDNRGDQDATALAIVTPGVLGTDYFREIAAVFADSGGGPSDLARIGGVMRGGSIYLSGRLACSGLCRDRKAPTERLREQGHAAVRARLPRNQAHEGLAMPSSPKREVEQMLSERCSFDVIEDRIERMTVTDDLKAALWRRSWLRDGAVKR